MSRETGRCGGTGAVANAGSNFDRLGHYRTRICRTRRALHVHIPIRGEDVTPWSHFEEKGMRRGGNRILSCASRTAALTQARSDAIMV